MRMTRMNKIPLGLLLLLAIILPLGLSGCVVGYNSVLFATRSNAGVDLDAVPATTEVSIAREEIVIAPTFEGGQTLPVMASFSSDNNFASKFLFGVGATFSTGEAAFNMATLYNSKIEALTHRFGCESAYKVWLGTKPNLPWGLEYQTSGEVKPVTFTTDTTIGIKIGWDNNTVPVPTSFKVGFNRKELAWVPVTLETCDNGTTYRANIPSLLATVNAEVEAAGVNNSDFSFLQYFATGVAASELSKKYGVRRAMLSRLDPENIDAFSRRSDELAAFQTRIELATDIGLNAAERITTAGQVRAAYSALNEYPFAAGDCPVLPDDLPNDDETVLQDDQLNSVKKTFGDCLGSSSNADEAIVSQFEAAVTAMDKAVPVPSPGVPD